ncbi:MAG: 50S ribosomal protein L11 methyltransferase [Clostridia bacterium]|nr:50S ribosomal protein L11 methyltransferase [Clostridia bacterium]
MNYKEVKIRVDSQRLDLLILLLEQKGITGLVIQDPNEVDQLIHKSEPWHWDYIDESVLSQLQDEPCVTFYVGEEEPIEAMLEDFEDFDFQISLVNDQEWLHKWKDYFFPARVTQRIVVKPSWAEYEEKQGDIVIAIDPGTAFGTGTHATTKLCLRLLEQHVEENDTVLDVGAGTGILSIASAFLGCKKVLSVDIDPEAVASTLENVKINSVSDIVDVQCANLTEGLDFCADIVVSNLMADLVIMLSESVAKHLKGKSVYIAGGILSEKESLVRKALTDAGFIVESVIYEDDWCAIAAKYVAVAGGKEWIEME